MSKYIKSKLAYIISVLVVIGIFNITLYLYQIHVEILLYANLISLFFAGLYLLLDYFKYQKHLKMVKHIQNDTLNDIDYALDEIEMEYQNHLRSLNQEITDIKERDRSELEALNDYYTMWVHQIKTPISAMKLILEEDSNIDLSIELLKIEQYVQMVLTYLRLHEDVSDYVFETVNLDNIIKEILRNYALVFINKNIKIKFNETSYELVSDEKWLSMAIEQIISNALKYTKNGGMINIELDKGILLIQDNGIGISAEDIPLVFEKGYSGYQGRDDKRASGIGLYLTKTILKRLHHPIWIESKPNEGTRVYIDLRQKSKYYD